MVDIITIIIVNEVWQNINIAALNDDISTINIYRLVSVAVKNTIQYTKLELLLTFVPLLQPLQVKVVEVVEGGAHSFWMVHLPFSWHLSCTSFAVPWEAMLV